MLEIGTANLILQLGIACHTDPLFNCKRIMQITRNQKDGNWPSEYSEKL